jgi:SsrA-binding protein
MSKSRGAHAGGPPTIVNRKARFDYEILESQEAGIALEGSEVKSILNGKVNLAGAFCRVIDGELWLLEMDIAPYEMASAYPPDRRRKRKLLMKKREINLIRRKSEEKGLSLLPTKVYFRNRRVKVEVSIARGKKKYDKRDAIAKRDERREHSD